MGTCDSFHQSDPIHKKTARAREFVIEGKIGNERREAKAARNAIRHIPELLKFAGSMVPEPSIISIPFIVDKE